MSTSNTTSSRQNAPVTQPQEQSTLYKMVMTPVILVSFLLSLLVVDLRYSALRSRYHAEQHTSRLPPWLHRIVYRYVPYQYVDVTVGEQGGRGYYHSKQRKLMKMEVQDAFEIRRAVLMVLGLLVVGAAWTMWWGTSLALAILLG